MTEIQFTFLKNIYVDKVFDEYILFMPTSLVVGKVDSELYTLVKYIQTYGWEGGIKKFKKEHPNITMEAIFKILQEIRELNQPKNTPKLDTQIFPVSLVIYITDACNFKCVYCYENSYEKTFTRMSEDTAKRIIELLFRSPAKKVNIGFFGGEPLLEFDIIRKIVNFAKQKSKETGKVISFSITTNGYLITKDIAKFFKQEKFNVVLSIDGPKEIHDANRRLKSGKRTFDKVWENAKLLKSLNMPVTIRSTILPHQVTKYYDIFKFFATNGFKNIHIEVATTKDGIGKKNLEILKNELCKIARYEITHVRENNTILYSHFRKYIYMIGTRSYLTFPCGAGRKLFGVSPTGVLYLCQRFVGDDNFVVGNVYEGINTNSPIIQKILFKKAECNDCWAYPLCRGGCYYINYLTCGDIKSPYPEYCEYIREIIRLSLWIYMKLKNKYPNILKHLIKSPPSYSPLIGVSEAHADETKLKEVA